MHPLLCYLLARPFEVRDLLPGHGVNPSLGPPLETSCFKGSWRKTPYSERACAKLRCRIMRATCGPGGSGRMRVNPSLGPPLETSCFKGSWKKIPYSERACAKLRCGICGPGAGQVDQAVAGLQADLICVRLFLVVLR